MTVITPRTARRHEALVLRLEALAGQVGAIAARQPGLAVGDDVRALAEHLLHQSRPFVRELGPLPPAAPSYGGLGAQLGEVRARLDAFELRHTAWDAAHKCIMWATNAGPLPVARLHPQLAVVIDPVAEQRRANAQNIWLAQRIDARYDEGYRDALAGRSPDSRISRLNPDGSFIVRG